MTRTNIGPIVAAIPYFGETGTIARAVGSVLRQKASYVDAVVVICDSHPAGLPELPPQLDDPRVILFNLDLPEHKGPFFAKEVVRRALPPDAVLATLDSDDMWHPRFVERCLGALERGALAALPGELRTTVDGIPQVPMRDSAGKATVSLWPDLPLRDGLRQIKVQDQILTPNLFFRRPLQGLFRTEILRATGGFYGGELFGYDDYLGALMLMHGGLAQLTDVLYLRFRREGSLTTDATTGLESPARAEVRARQQGRYTPLFEAYTDLRPDLHPEHRPEFAALMRADVFASTQAETLTLQRSAERLAGLIDEVLAAGDADEPVALGAKS